MMGDAELLRCYAEERSEEAFAELVRRHVNLVYGVALRRTGGNAHLAEDVVQGVFTDLARKAAALSRHAALAGWLYKSTRFAAAQAVRTERRRQAREQKAYVMQNDLRPSAPDTAWEGLRPELDDVLDGLSERDREAVVLRFYAAKPFAEIGAALSLTEDAARRRVDRALEKLRLLLVRRGVTSTAGALVLALTSNAAIAAPAGFATAVTGTALAGAAAMGAAGTATVWGLFAIMNTTKMTGVVSVVAVMAIGTAVYQTTSANQTEAALAEATGKQANLQARLQTLELELRKEQARAAAAEEDASKLLVAIQKMAARPAAAAPMSRPSVGLTREEVQTRYRNADQLARNGQYAEALHEYLWCYDEGMVRVASMNAVRSSFLTAALAKLGVDYPPALDALRERRAEAERRMAADPSDSGAVGDFASLNRALKEEHRTLALYDQLPADDPRQRSLGMRVFDLLVKEQRYADATAARAPNEMFTSFEVHRTRTIPGGRLTEDQAQRSKESAVHTAAKNIEALAGAGDTTNAAKLIAKVLELDSSPAARAVLREHLGRAGHLELIGESSAP